MACVFGEKKSSRSINWFCRRGCVKHLVAEVGPKKAYLISVVRKQGRGASGCPRAACCLLPTPSVHLGARLVYHPSYFHCSLLQGWERWVTQSWWWEGSCCGREQRRVVRAYMGFHRWFLWLAQGALNLVVLKSVCATVLTLEAVCLHLIWLKLEASLWNESIVSLAVAQWICTRIIHRFTTFPEFMNNSLCLCHSPATETKSHSSFCSSALSHAPLHVGHHQHPMSSPSCVQPFHPHVSSFPLPCPTGYHPPTSTSSTLC